MTVRNYIAISFLLPLVFQPALALSSETLTPAQQRMQAAKQVIADNPNSVDGFNRLAMAMAQRARETAEPAFYEQASEALEKSFSIEPNNYAARKVQTWVLLGQHRFAEALRHAKALNQEVPDDLIVYSLLTDANVELGNYDEAEKACQWMLNMRPGNIPGLTRGAYLRELWGDVDGAIELMQRSLGKTPQFETETVAWLQTHVAHLFLMKGQLKEAEHYLDLALDSFPNYHYALVKQAELRTNQGRLEEALKLYKLHYEVAPHPENLYLVGQAAARCGHHEDARTAFREFEQAAIAESNNLDNANRQLIAYYAEEGDRPTEALRLARKEIEQRKDIYAWEALAVALYANRAFAEARQAVGKALKLETQDAKLFYLAGRINMDAGELKEAQTFFQKAIRTNPTSTWAGKARTAIGTNG